MNYDQLIVAYKKAKIKLTKYGAVREAGRNYDLYKIEDIKPGRPAIIITTGFHGEEFNGPISVLKLFIKIRNYARRQNLNLVVYPCVNPSGFDHHTRYNASHENQNNDFLRYQIKGGRWVDILKPNEKFVKYKLVKSGAKEVRALQADLKASGFLKKLPVAVIDIHQDDDLDRGDYYAYIFGERTEYEKIMKRAQKWGTRARSVNALNFNAGRKTYDVIDRDGFIVQHDGTLTDLFFRLGVCHSVTVETNARTSLSKVTKIYWEWVKGVIDLVKKSA